MRRLQLCKSGFTTHLLLQSIEIINDDSNEEVEGEEGSTDNKDDKVEVIVEACFILWLLVDLPGVHSVRHDLHPALECRL